MSHEPSPADPTPAQMHAHVCVYRQPLASSPSRLAATRRAGGVQECVQEWKHKGCESQFRRSHPVRLTPQCFTYLAKMPSSLGCSRVICAELHILGIAIDIVELLCPFAQFVQILGIDP